MSARARSAPRQPVVNEHLGWHLGWQMAAAHLLTAVLTVAV